MLDRCAALLVADAEVVRSLANGAIVDIAEQNLQISAVFRHRHRGPGTGGGFILENGNTAGRAGSDWPTELGGVVFGLGADFIVEGNRSIGLSGKVVGRNLDFVTAIAQLPIARRGMRIDFNRTDTATTTHQKVIDGQQLGRRIQEVNICLEIPLKGMPITVQVLPI